MNIEELREFCLAGLEPPLDVTLKVPEDQFDELVQTTAIIQGSHCAKRKWMTIVEESRFSRAEKG